jgi:hypothetical protein
MVSGRPHAGELSFAQRIRLRDAYRDLIDERMVGHFITFNFGYLIKPLNALDRMKGLCAAVERKTLGRAYYKHPGGERLFVLGFVERDDLNPHWHCVARVPQSMNLSLFGDGPEIWKKLAPRGQIEIERIENQRSVRNYCSKRLHNIGAPEDVFIYGATKPKA